MPDLPSQDREQLNTTARNLLRTRRRGIDDGPGSDWNLWALTLGALAWILFRQAAIARRLLTRSRAFGDYLRQFAFEMGIGRNVTQTSIDATPAKGQVIILSTTGGQTLAAGKVFRHVDGTEFTLDADVTTSATATKTLRVGNRSGRRRLFQGHAGAGFVAAVVGEVYQFARTGEYCAIRDADNGTSLKRYLFDLFNDLDAEPEVMDTFAQKFGAVGRITATVPGISGNKDPKDTLQIDTPPGTIQATAHILTLAEGDETMAAGEVQAAIRTLLIERAPVLSAESLRQIVLTFPGAELRECYVVPALYGVQSYQIYPIAADSQYCGAVTLAEIAAYVRARMPQAQLITTAVTESTEPAFVIMRVHVAGVYEPDFEIGDVVSYAINASTSQSITLSSVARIAVGNRVIIANTAPHPYIVQRRVQAIAGNVLSLDKPLPFPATTSGAHVTPGGPLADSIIEAIYDAYDARAPAMGIVQVRYPVSSVSDDPKGIAAAVSRVPGVNDVGIQPDPTDPLTAGVVLVPATVISMTVERTV